MEPNLTIRKDTKGRLYVRPFLGYDPCGKKIEPSHFLKADTLAEAEREAADWYASILGNPLLSDALKDYTDALEDARKPANTLKTYKTYRGYLEPHVARIRVRDLTVRKLTNVYRALLNGGGRGGLPLSNNTVLGVHWFLRGAYKWFGEQGMVTVNPTLMATKPTRESQEAKPLDDISLMKLIKLLDEIMASDATDDESVLRRNVAFAARMALYTGVRCGEACGLWRSDANTQSSYLHIAGTVVETNGKPSYQPKPKGKRARNVALLPEDLKAIRRHILWQESLFVARGTEVPLVSLDGTYMRPSKVAATFAAMASEAGLPKGTHFHTLRHTHATWLLSGGVDVKTVAERLGHASPSTTLSIYAHVLPGRDQGAALVFKNALDAL